MSEPKNMAGMLREAAVGLAVAIILGIVAKYSDIPTKVAVVETKVESVEKVIASMDKKLDRLLERRR